MHGGEVFVPKIASMKIVDLAEAIAPDSQVEIIGIRPGEKLHEVLLSEHESRHSVELSDMFVIEPAEPLWFGYGWREKGEPLQEGFSYQSDTNESWLSKEELQAMVRTLELSE
jgi:UDP-N-acetylglucosamine 4,6-dehydratase